MNDTGRLLFMLPTSTRELPTSTREDDWRSADEWRRLHSRPDALPMPVVEPRPRRSFATIRRLLPRHA